MNKSGIPSTSLSSPTSALWTTHTDTLTTLVWECQQNTSQTMQAVHTYICIHSLHAPGPPPVYYGEQLNASISLNVNSTQTYIRFSTHTCTYKQTTQTHMCVHKRKPHWSWDGSNWRIHFRKLSRSYPKLPQNHSDLHNRLLSVARETERLSVS